VKFVAPAVAALAIWTGVQVTAGDATWAAQERRAPRSASRVDRDQLMRVVRTLSQPSFEGRRTGTTGNLLARQFIRDTFQQIGLAPATPDFVQPFTFVPASPTGRLSGGTIRTAPVEGTNVLAIQAGRQREARALVVSAHYDHLGIRNGATYPGADDNASGVAALLAVARYLHANPPAHTVILAAFDAEEQGLQGAKAFARAPPVPLGTIALDVNFDMVSRNDRHEIYAAGTFQNPSLRPVVDEVQRRTGVAIRFGHDRPDGKGDKGDDWTLQSDHGVFHQAGVPFIYFGVEDHPDYHKPTDTADKIDPVFFGDVVEMLVDFVLTADSRLP
jgi:Zn-dependent M28 family amino/carboxypeptidase